MSYEAIIHEMQAQLEEREAAYVDRRRRHFEELMDLAEEANVMLDRRRNRKARAKAQAAANA